MDSTTQSDRPDTEINLDSDLTDSDISDIDSDTESDTIASNSDMASNYDEEFIFQEIKKFNVNMRILDCLFNSNQTTKASLTIFA